MIKLLSIGLVIVAILGAGIYFRFVKQSQSPIPAAIVSGLTSSPATEQERISSLENKVEVLEKQVGNSTTPASSPLAKPSASSSLDQRLSSVELTAQSLQGQINQLKISGNTTTSAPATSPSKAPAYIPLGWIGAISALDWVTVTTQEFTIDPADYPGYQSMQFEVNLRIYQGNGKAYARLLNNTDGTAMQNSEVSTTSQDYNWVSSATFVLPSGKKAYRMQLKSSTSYEAGVQNARIKVNF